MYYISVLHLEAKGSAKSAQSLKFFIFSPVSISGQDTILFYVYKDLYKEIYKHLAIIN